MLKFLKMLRNFDQINFADEDFIVYSFKYKSNDGYYCVKDSMFFTLPK